MNTFTSQQIFLIRIKLKQNILILKEDDNTSFNFVRHENEKFILEKDYIERDHRNLLDKSLNTGSHIKDGLLGCTSQDELFASELSSFLKEVKFNE